MSGEGPVLRRYFGRASALRAWVDQEAPTILAEYRDGGHGWRILRIRDMDQPDPTWVQRYEVDGVRVDVYDYLTARLETVQAKRETRTGPQERIA